jgi:retron-type reverse transcriptase
MVRHLYSPLPLKTFILRDPKTRKISKSSFRDRIVHHALIKIIEPVFDKTFIYDSCANRKGKGTLFAIERFDEFKRKVTRNLKKEAFCLKADIKHYFQEVNHEVLLKIIRHRIKDEKTIWLIKTILNNNVHDSPYGKGMPLDNLTSQFFANVYLNELDYFIKHKLEAKYYLRYVDDFIIFHNSKEQLEEWKDEIDAFLRKGLLLKLHLQKSKITSLSKGIDFVGFRNFYHYRLLRARNIRQISLKIGKYKKNELTKEKLPEMFQGWNAYARWANAFKLRRRISRIIP